MVQLKDISEEQHSEPECKDFHRLVRPLILDTNKMDIIWSRIQNIPYMFDDFTRGRRDVFFNWFFKVDTLAYEVGNFGIIYFTDVCPPVNAIGHVVFWDRRFTNRTPYFKKICMQLFDEFGIHRISSIIPLYNRAAILFAKRVGFQVEGVHREIVLSLGKWHDAAILGLLRRDFNGNKYRRDVSSATSEHDLASRSSESTISNSVGLDVQQLPESVRSESTSVSGTT